MTSAEAHAARGARLRAAIAAASAGAPLGLAKRTSNLFRDRAEGRKHRLELGDFRHVLAVDAAAGWVDVEGLATYEVLVDATLPHGVMPAVVPQLKTITIGGAAAGVGIEATSFREGLVHDTLLELEVLLPAGDVVVATPDNEHRYLFYGFPNSYGTLGYALRLKARTRPVERFVRVEHRPFGDAGAFFAALDAACAAPASDFVDGVVFGRGDHVLSVASFVDDAPHTSDYTFERIYYRSLKTTPVDFLATRDYLWRWDTDWFWCSKNVGAQHPLVRRLLGRGRLNSRTYTKNMRFNSRWGFTRAWSALRGLHPESVIQDVDIPLPRAAEFLDFLLAEIGIVPIWICPIRPADATHPFTLYPLTTGVRYVNFGFWDVMPSRQAHPPGHFNRLVEREAIALGGIKSLYSDSFFTRDEFERAYGIERYRALKARYDPDRRALDLYDKVVLRR
ncbi:MAG: FAD-binding oxidoreductase [Rubrivivax sp.]|nr:FAD-binding oxidoreductase [Rubrivivax sp.]